MKYKYVVDPSADEPIMLIDTHIGSDDDEGEGVDGAIFQRELLSLDAMGKERIQVWINSPGGVVTDAYGIYSSILNSKTKVDTYAMGIAASSAGLIFQAGRKRIMADYAVLMYHNLQGAAQGKMMDTMTSSIIAMVASRTGHTTELVAKMFDQETWITPDKALETGLCDEIQHSGELNKKRKMPTQATAMWKESNLIMNKIINTQKSFKMIKVTNKLGLTEDANEASILAAITAIENKATALEVENKATKEAVDAAKEAYDKLKDEFDAQKNELDSAEDKAKKLEDKLKEDEKTAKEEKAKNLVEGFAVAGRIKNSAESIEKWSNLAKVDFEGTKAMIEDLPLNKSAVKIEVAASDVDKETSIKIASSSAYAMAEISNRIARK